MHANNEFPLKYGEIQIVSVCVSHDLSYFWDKYTVFSNFLILEDLSSLQKLGFVPNLSPPVLVAPFWNQEDEVDKILGLLVTGLRRASNLLIDCMVLCNRGGRSGSFH